MSTISIRLAPFTRHICIQVLCIIFKQAMLAAGSTYLISGDPVQIMPTSILQWVLMGSGVGWVSNGGGGLGIMLMVVIYVVVFG